MYILYVFLITIPVLTVVALLMTERGHDLKRTVQFFISGFDLGFKPGEIFFLWKIARTTKLEDPTALFWSLPVLDQSTAEIVQRARQTGTDTDESTQRLLSRLYAYRTKMELDHSKKKLGVESTRDMLINQKVRILLRGVGVFTSRVVRNTSRSLVLDYPSNPSLQATSIPWVGKTISVYFWRHDDAGYVFETTIVPDPVSDGKAVIHVSHTNELIRSQKRKSIRAKCSIGAQLYLVKPQDQLESALEPEPGMKCRIDDLSEDGAMILIGGKAVKNMKIKLQFMVHDVLIVMAGIIRAVEYNENTNQSRIHFECEELNPRMKNAVLTFVYNVLPEEEKQELDAIRLTEEDGLAEAESSQPPQLESSDNDIVLSETKPYQDIESMPDLPELPDFASKKN